MCIEKKELDKLLEAVESIGYRLVKLDTPKIGTVELKISRPVFVNAHGVPIDPETEEPLPRLL